MSTRQTKFAAFYPNKWNSTFVGCEKRLIQLPTSDSTEYIKHAKDKPKISLEDRYQWGINRDSSSQWSLKWSYLNCLGLVVKSSCSSKWYLPLFVWKVDFSWWLIMATYSRLSWNELSAIKSDKHAFTCTFLRKHMNWQISEVAQHFTWMIQRLKRLNLESQ